MAEREPLLHDRQCKTSDKVPKRKPSVLYLVPFVLVASIARGITIGPRVEVYTSVGNANHVLMEVPFGPTVAINTISVDPSLAVSPTILELPRECTSDPDVRATAATLQAAALTTGGVLSILTTGYWGLYGDEHGRTRVVTVLIIGLLIWDLMFAIASGAGHGIPSLASSTLLVLGAVAEGLAGSWATFFAIMNAYISDCTDPESRAMVFSRFQGLYFVGNSLGPAAGSAILQLFKIPKPSRLPTIFCMALAANVINLLYTRLILPESVSSEDRESARRRHQAEANRRKEVATRGMNASEPMLHRLARSAKRKLKDTVAPLAPLAPRRNNTLDTEGETARNPMVKIPIWRWDFDLTLIGLAFWCNYLNMGVYPNKYLYAEHIFGWEAEQIGYYVTISSALRSLWLVVVLPAIIQSLKPKLPDPIGEETCYLSDPAVAAARQRAHLLPTIRFDLWVARLSLLLDSISFTLTSAIPSETGFIVTTLLSCFGGGMAPATQSVAIALVDREVTGKLTAPDTPVASDECSVERSPGPEEEHNAEHDVERIGPGQLFGAMSVLQALGQTVLGPLVVGEVYALTVSSFPRMIFVFGATLLFAAFIFLCLLRPGARIPPRFFNLQAS